MKRIVFYFMFCLIILVLAEWSAVNEILCRIKIWVQRNRLLSIREK